jgi:hypothetical protein
MCVLLWDAMHDAHCAMCDAMRRDSAGRRSLRCVLSHSRRCSQSPLCSLNCHGVSSPLHWQLRTQSISALPVVSSDGAIVSVVSNRDIRTAMRSTESTQRGVVRSVCVGCSGLRGCVACASGTMSITRRVLSFSSSSSSSSFLPQSCRHSTARCGRS